LASGRREAFWQDPFRHEASPDLRTY
jgi:hypothetical protein